MRSHRMLETITPAALAGMLALGLAACGSSSGGAGGIESHSSAIKVPPGIQTPATEAQSGGIRGGTLTVLDHTDFEHLDPGQAYSAVDYEAMYATQRPLYSHKPNSVEPIPDMAADMPEISKDNKTVTVHLKEASTSALLSTAKSHRPTLPTRWSAVSTRMWPTHTSRAISARS